jgi:hypothetical protein
VEQSFSGGNHLRKRFAVMRNLSAIMEKGSQHRREVGNPRRRAKNFPHFSCECLPQPEKTVASRQKSACEAKNQPHIAAMGSFKPRARGNFPSQAAKLPCEAAK